MDKKLISGRRKTSVARVAIKSGNGNITVNNKPLNEYFTVDTHQMKVLKPLELTENVGKYDFHVNVMGGGITGQAEAVRLAVSKALCTESVENRPVLKSNGFLRRDSRMVERKKSGQKKARKRFQFSKR